MVVQLGPWVARIVSIFWWPETWAAMVVLLCINRYRKQRFEPMICWPVVGMLPSVLLNIRGIFDWFTDQLARCGGTICFKGPVFSGLEAVATCDPKNIEYILKTNFKNFPKGDEYHDMFHDLFADGIANADGESWRTQRRIAISHLHNKDFRALSSKNTKDVVQLKLIPMLEHSVKLGAVLDLQDVFMRYAFESTWTSAFGTNPGCLSIEFPRIPFSEAIDTIMEAIFYRHMMPSFLWRILRYFNVGTEKNVSDAKALILNSIHEQMLMKKDFTGDGHDIISRCMRSFGDSELLLRDTVLNFILAARDTSALTLSWFFWLITQHPHVESKIIEELSKILREKRREGPSPSGFEVEDLAEMVYLHACLCETLRLYPPIPVNNKSVVEEDTLPDGTRVRPGMKVFYMVYCLARMEWVWGKDCKEFRPERWIDEHGKLRNETGGFRFLAFNEGPRTCAGQDMGFLQMKYAASEILLNFKVEVVEGHHVSPRTTILMTMQNGLLAKMRPRVL